MPPSWCAAIEARNLPANICRRSSVSPFRHSCRRSATAANQRHCAAPDKPRLRSSAIDHPPPQKSPPESILNGIRLFAAVDPPPPYILLHPPSAAAADRRPPLVRHTHRQCTDATDARLCATSDVPPPPTHALSLSTLNVLPVRRRGTSHPPPRHRPSIVDLSPLIRRHPQIAFSIPYLRHPSSL